MIIGVVREIMQGEKRVALTPEAVQVLTRKAYPVLVERHAGIGSGFTDDAYRMAGAKIVKDAKAVFQLAELVMKVKEPMPREYGLLREGQILFTFFHFAASRSLTEALLASGAIALAYETVEEKSGALPILAPMSDVAGRLAVQVSAHYLESAQGGKGILLSGVQGRDPAKVTVIGAGVVGRAAAQLATGMGAEVTILDINANRLRQLECTTQGNLKTKLSSPKSIEASVVKADVVISGVLIPGDKAPRLVTRDMVREMEPGSVVVDVAIDQGGSMESSRPTTHDAPCYLVDDVIHYCVRNMPALVPLSASRALSNVTLPYVLALAEHGVRKAQRILPPLQKGISIAFGQVVDARLADIFDLEYDALEAVLPRNGAVQEEGDLMSDDAPHVQSEPPLGLLHPHFAR
ncbi:MAG: alanine dehydrogenase [Magnetococcales bacterium]|nr:alanine dehydrogenase [Magnetococcales bacterium]